MVYDGTAGDPRRDEEPEVHAVDHDEPGEERELPGSESAAGSGSSGTEPARDTAAAEEPTEEPVEEPAGHKHSKKKRKAGHDELETRLSDLSAENEALRAETRDLKDKWLRNAAEFENFRKRTRREWELLQQRVKAEVILEMLAVVDDFERAFSAAGERDDDFIQGIRLIYNNLMASLERLGVRKLEALHAPFDPAFHMAVAQLEREGADSNHVIEIVQEGYLLGDLVIRPAKVVIAK